MSRRSETQDRIHLTLETARAYSGYRARPGVENLFLGQVGYLVYEKWDGAYLDVVLRASGIPCPAHVDTASALGFYIDNGQTVRTPRQGDIYFSNGDGLRVGLVTDIANWKLEKTFRALEGQVNSGLPRAAKERDGVFERTRTSQDVLLFVRPDYRPVTETIYVEDQDLLLVKPSNFSYTASPKLQAACTQVQLALAAHPAVRLQEASKGKLDLTTRRAVARFQRYMGFLGDDAGGQLDAITLERLTRETGNKYFRVPASPEE